MKKTEPITYRQFTARFMASLKQKRQKVLAALSSSTTTEEFIIQMLQDKDYAYEYAKEMQENKGFDRIFKTLRRKVCEQISQSEYQKVIDYIAQDLDNKFLSYGENPNSMELLVSKIVSAVRVDNIKRSQYRHDLMERQELQEKPNNYQKENDEWQKMDDQQNDYYKRERPYQPEQDNYLNTSVIPKRKTYKNAIQNSSIKKTKIESKSYLKDQKVLNIGKNESILNVPQQTQSIKRSFNASDLLVEIRYLKTLVDYQMYNSNGFELKDNLQKYVRKYLTENYIIVRRQISEIKIMEEIQFIKSKEAGNYRFNPFCDAVQIWLRLKNNQNFNYDFTVEGDIKKLQIKPIPIEPHEWNKGLMKLTPKSTIDELVKYVCEKRQATHELVKVLTEGLKNLGGANIAQDLFGWERSDFASMKVKPTYIFQIQELIQQIKDSSNIVTEKTIDQKRKQCIKAATSHKILRYVVYKADGPEEVKKISWLNMENLFRALEIVRKEIHNKELLDQLEDYFSQFALDPDGKPLAFSRGMILYGPPGTGKTVLTESLPNIIGFHLIEKGLSAADFMKSLVGETSRMIKDLVNRAAISPWLLCSIGIDQVDGLVPDRKDKDEKNKGEGISIMLSVIKGNKDVPNLIYMTSTNYIKKIDEAIGRRLNGKYQVGRPNPNERKMIIQEKVEYLKDKQELMGHLIRITSNFTGAALEGLANSLLKSLKMKKMKNQVQQLTIHEITEAAIVNAKQYNITFGVFTLPEIYRNQCEKKFIFTETFLKRISKHFLLVQNLNGNQFKIMYANEIQKFYEGRLTPIYEQEQDKITIGARNGNNFQALANYVKLIFEGKKYEIKCFGSSDYKNNYNKYSNEINDFLVKREKNLNKKTVLIIEDHPDSPGEIKFTANLFQRNHMNLYMIYYILPGYDISSFSEALFAPKNRLQQMNPIETENYSGRIMVELNEETRMAFQLKICMDMESKVAFRLFLKSEEGNTPKTVIPELVDFFTKQQISYLLLIDYELLLQNDAFQDKKILEVMEEKMLEAKSYKRSAVIIDLDSIILLNENASDSSMGRSMSYSIQNYNLYQILLSYMREFASTAGNDSRWLTMIVKHPELIKMVKKQLSWPKYPEEVEKQIEEAALDEEKRCFRCTAFYTERENKEERKCMQHPGRIIDTVTKAFENVQAQQLKARMLCTKKKDDKTEENRYVFACCMKGLNEQGENAYHHIIEDQFETDEDELYKDKIQSVQKWNKVLTYFHV